MSTPPVLLSRSVCVWVWLAGTTSCSEVGVTTPRAVSSVKFCTTTSSSWSSTTSADSVL